MSLKEQIEAARKNVDAMKQHSPYIFPEFNAMCTAKYELELAKTKFEEAKKVWENL